MKNYLKKFKVGWKLFSLLFLTLAAFSYAMFQGGFVSWFLFYSFLPFALYSLLLMLYPLRGFRVKRRINQEQFTVGQRLIGTVTVQRSFPFPLFYLIVEDVLTERLAGVKRLEEPKKLFFPWFKRSVSFSYALQHMPRGEHQFTTIRVRTGDLFGLIEKEVTFKVEHYFLVYPTMVNLHYSTKQKQYDQGTSSSQSKFWQDTTMAVGIREYQPGDKFAWIDWKATARRNAIMTKEFEQMQSQDVVVFLDRSPSKVFESVVNHAASFINEMVKSGARVGLISIGKDHQIFPLKSGEQHVQTILYHLAKVDSDSTQPFSALLDPSTIQGEMKQVTNLLVTSQLHVDLVRKLEGLSSLQSSIELVLIKSVYDQLSKEEHVLMDRLKKRQIGVTVYDNRETEMKNKEVVGS